MSTAGAALTLALFVHLLAYLAGGVPAVLAVDMMAVSALVAAAGALLAYQEREWALGLVQACRGR